MDHLEWKIQQKYQEMTSCDVIEELNSEEVIRLVPTIIYLLLISITGIPGNGLVCYIYRSKYTMSSSRWFIFFLAAVDLILCFLIIPTEIVTIFSQFNFTYKYLCKLSAFINLWTLLSLGFTLLIVSIDRYRKVCRPLGWQINFNKARILCAAAVILGFFISIPVFNVYGIYKFTFEGLNVTASECSFRQSSTESDFAFYYILFGMTMFTSALVTICVLYGFIGSEIKKHIRKENIKRDVSLSASMAKRHHTINTVSSELEMKRNRFFTEELPKKSVKFQKPSVSTSNDDTDEISAIRSIDEDDTCDFEISVIPEVPMRTKKMQKSKPRRMRRAKARKATFSMFLISVAFVLSYLPFLSLLLARSIVKDFDENLSDGGRAVYKFFLRSYFFNCAVNPFIYGISDSKFRESCKDVIYRISDRISLFLRSLCKTSW